VKGVFGVSFEVLKVERVCMSSVEGLLDHRQECLQRKRRGGEGGRSLNGKSVLFVRNMTCVAERGLLNSCQGRDGLSCQAARF